MAFKDFLVRKMLKRKLKGLPQDQQDMIIKLVTENPEFFKKISDQVKVKTKQGMNEQAAMMQVMRENQNELQTLMKDSGFAPAQAGVQNRQQRRQGA